MKALGTPTASAPDSAARAEREFVLSEREYEAIRALVREHTGISLADSKRDLVYSRLVRRLRALGLKTFEQYCALLKSGDERELEDFANAITTNLTSFFREDHHFQYLAQTVLPALERSNAGTKRIRIWSAGCSTGEEPYSIAIVLREALAHLKHWDIRILATDLDSQVLAKASAGVYAADRFERVARARVQRWFEPRDGGAALTAGADLKSLITFKQLNLMHDWPMRGPFDVIFCRNVVIYFDKPTQKRLFGRMADLQPAGTHLFIGHSENLFKLTDRYQLIGKTAYRRV